MMLKGNALLAGVLAATLLSALSAPASARSLSINNTTWTSVFSLQVSGGFGTVTCPPITLSGSFHSRTIAKVRSSLIGYVNSAGSTGSCSAIISRTRVLTERLPWHVRYMSFSGDYRHIEHKHAGDRL